MSALPARQGPLTGIRIVDLSMWWSGPLATELMALMGAEVIKIESVQRVDGWRLAVRLMADAGPEASNVFNGVNLNKLGVTLDLGAEEGHEILRTLVERADALVENYSPRVMGNLGLSDEVLRSWNPGLLILSMPAFGLTGPWRDFVGFAPTIEQLSGLPEMTGYQGGPPTLSGNSIADPTAGFTGSLALLAGLYAKKRDGGGSHIDLSQLEALTALFGRQIVGTAFAGEPPARAGNGHEWKAPYGAYPCDGADSWVTLAVSTDAQWKGLCDAIGQAGLHDDPRFSDPIARHENAAELGGIIGEWTSGLDRHRAAELLQAAGVPSGAVYRPSDLLNDAHLRERGYFVDLDRDFVGRHPHQGLPFHFSRTPGKVTTASPTLGRDNHAVLREIVGLSDERIAELEGKDVIGTQALE